MVNGLTRAEKIEMIQLLEEKQRRINENRLAHYRPYSKQREFHDQGAVFRERALIAANQVGKTVAGAFEVAMHLTGLYPDDWKGIRFNRPVSWMAGSESAELTRKGVQRLLLGKPEDRNNWGTGSIPKDCLMDWSMRSGVADAVASCLVKHKSGGNSSLQFASYDQGRGKWQADTLDGVWFDEEPPEDIYTEGITRTNVTMGPIILTATPLLGMSAVIRRYFSEPSPDRIHITMTLEDAEHYTPEERARIIASYPPHERDARTKGIPMLGSGAIFPVVEDLIKCNPFTIPDHWPQIGGLDFGYDHPFAAAKLAWDRDNDCIYLINGYKQRGADLAIAGISPTVAHASMLKPWGKIKWAWPHDGLQHDKGSGEELASQYRAQGLDMLPDKATHPPKDGDKEGTGGNSVEAGIADMLDRMQTGRFKVFSHIVEFFDEFRLYHRKDGKIVKEFDDLISATRYAIMMKRFSECPNQFDDDDDEERPYITGRSRSGGY